LCRAIDRRRRTISSCVSAGVLILARLLKDASAAIIEIEAYVAAR
jgi:hypothetical protein